MTVLIVGGDYITSFKHLLSTQQDTRIEHWDGRKKGFNKRAFPNETHLVVVICDFVNHSLTHSVKKKANREGIPLVYCHRSINELKQKLQDSDQADEDCCYLINDQFKRLH